MDPQLVQFYRQYMQQTASVTLPAGTLLVQTDIQDCLFRYFFDPSRNSYLPPPRYQLRTLKRIIAEIEKSLKQPEEDQVSNELIERLTELITTPQQSDIVEAQQKSVVTYYAPTDYDNLPSPFIRINEARNILGSGNNVGLRTWEASLRLACYLMQEPDLISNRNVLELGAGTGFLSLFCAGILSARRVLATDGLGPIVESMLENVKLNKHSFRDPALHEPVPCLLDWRELSDLDSIIQSSSSSSRIDTILGADITYAPDMLKPLANLLSELASRSPGVNILISATKRNAETLEQFVAICRIEFDFVITEILFECPDMHQQKGFFHSIAMPIKIFSLHRDKRR